MTREISHRLAAGVAALTLLAFGTAVAAHPPVAEPAAVQARPAAAPAPATVNMQGNDGASWAKDPHIHAFYDTARAAFANGPDKVDVAAFEAKSFAIFREFGVSKGVGAAAMQDHLKLIPRQIVGIVKEDPKVLDSYDNFILALMGPE